MSGVVIEHETNRGGVTVVDVPAKPYRSPIRCHVCNRTHAVKAVHLWLNDAGRCIVSPGVLEELRMTGDLGGFRVVGDVASPPTIRIGVDRAKQDYQHRATTIYRHT